MAIPYGVLRGRVDRFRSEDDTSTPHLQVRVLDETGQPWRIAVNVICETAMTPVSPSDRARARLIAGWRNRAVTCGRWHATRYTNASAA